MVPHDFGASFFDLQKAADFGRHRLFGPQVRRGLTRWSLDFGEAMPPVAVSTQFPQSDPGIFRTTANRIMCESLTPVLRASVVPSTTGAFFNSESRRWCVLQRGQVGQPTGSKTNPRPRR